jgi:hypothetical protein
MKLLSRREFAKSIRAHAKKYFNIKLHRAQMRWLKHFYYGGQRLLLLAPRRHGKSVAVNTIFLSWSLCNDTSLRILFASHKDKRAQDFSRRLRIAMDNPQMKKDYGSDRGFSWQVTYWQVTTAKKNKLEYPTVETVGVGGGVAGGSYDWVVFEDLCTNINSRTEQKRIDMKEWLNDVFNTLDRGPKMKAMFIGTRKHMLDYYNDLLHNPTYSCWVDKAIQDDGTTLWPERYPIEELEIIRTRDPINFSFEWQQIPVPAGGQSFKREWLQKAGSFYSPENLPANLDYYIGIDVSQGSLKKRSTYFAYSVVAVTTTGRIYVVEMFKDKLTIEEQKKVIRKLYWKYHNHHKLKQCLIEAPLAYAKLYASELADLPRAKAYSPVHDKVGGVIIADKLIRIETILSPIFERGEISLLNPDIDYFTRTFIDNEYIMFPEGDFDMLDSLVYACADAKGKRTFSGSPFIFGKKRRF